MNSRNGFSVLSEQDLYAVNGGQGAVEVGKVVHDLVHGDPSSFAEYAITNGIDFIDNNANVLYSDGEPSRISKVSGGGYTYKVETNMQTGKKSIIDPPKSQSRQSNSRDDRDSSGSSSGSGSDK